jgi:hypothetical protein
VSPARMVKSAPAMPSVEPPLSVYLWKAVSQRTGGAREQRQTGRSCVLLCPRRLMVREFDGMSSQVRLRAVQWGIQSP